MSLRCGRVAYLFALLDLDKAGGLRFSALVCGARKSWEITSTLVSLGLSGTF